MTLSSWKYDIMLYGNYVIQTIMNGIIYNDIEINCLL